MPVQPTRPGPEHRPDIESYALLSTDTRLRRAAEDVASHFRGVFAVETVQACIEESYRLLAATARISTHLPILATRFARDRLTAVALTQGDLVSTAPEVLFVCVHNAGRSQMAAALLAHHARGAVNVRSAGSAPADSINPAVRHVMAEIGIDLDHAFPKPLTTDIVQASDVVITMGCGDACPVFPGKRYLDWQLDDPAGRTTDQIRPIRDDIDARVRTLLTELTADRSGSTPAVPS